VKKTCKVYLLIAPEGIEIQRMRIVSTGQFTLLIAPEGIEICLQMR